MKIEFKWFDSKGTGELETGIIIGTLFVTGMLLSVSMYIPSDKPSTISDFSIYALLLISTFGLTKVVLEKSSRASSEKIKKTVIPGFLYALSITYGITLFCSGGVFYLLLILKDRDTSDYAVQFLTTVLVPITLLFISFTLIVSSVFFYVLWKKSIEREQELKVMNMKYKYQNLKSQINPHFLFNTLNTLSELVYIDAEKSDQFIQDLSIIYRYVLKNEEVDLIGLDQEIAFVKQYFNLQQARDQDKVKLEIDILDSESIKVVPVSLQVLIENAIKHNARSEESPLIIMVTMNYDYLIVSNPIQRMNTLDNSTKTGLENLKNRVKIVTGKEVLISEEDKTFTVQLPYKK